MSPICYRNNPNRYINEFNIQTENAITQIVHNWQKNKGTLRLNGLKI